MNFKRLSILTATVLALVVALAAGPATAMEGRGDAMTSMSFLGAEVAWAPSGEVGLLMLRVAGPSTDLEERFSGGAAPVFSLFDEHGEARADGTYNWELREEVEGLNSRVRDGANGRDLDAHDSSDRIDFSGRFQWGVFTIENGALVDASLIEPDAVQPPRDPKGSE